MSWKPSLQGCGALIGLRITSHLGGRSSPWRYSGSIYSGYSLPWKISGCWAPFKSMRNGSPNLNESNANWEVWLLCPLCTAKDSPVNTYSGNRPRTGSIKLKADWSSMGNSDKRERSNHSGSSQVLEAELRTFWDGLEFVRCLLNTNHKWIFSEKPLK